MLLAVADSSRASAQARSEAERTIDAAWKTPQGAASLLMAIGRTDAMKFAFQVRNHLKDERSPVKAAAAYAAARLDLDGDSSKARPRADDRVDSVRVGRGRGGRGHRATPGVASGCSSGKDVSRATRSRPARPPRARPCVGIRARYSRAELTESILKPSAKIAQGFEPQKIATVDGRTYEGFIVRESGNEVELRDAQGSATILPKNDIDARAKGESSIMPTGLADALTMHDFASLLAYLESLKAK